jgi:hypothetical protein
MKAKILSTINSNRSIALVNIAGSIMSATLCAMIAHNCLKQEPPLIIYGTIWTMTAILFMWVALKKRKNSLE